MSEIETKVHGREALFGPPRPAAGQLPGADGRRALFSAPPRRKGTVVIECEKCQARTPVPFTQLPQRLIPSLWMPGKSFSRLMQCPGCHQRAWCRVHWRSFVR